MSEIQLTNRDYLLYLIGAALVASILCVGMGLIVGANWKQVLGASMISTVVLYGMTVIRVTK